MRSWILVRAYVKAARLSGGYYFVIIDELNRADVDKAFGEFFTIFSGPRPDDWSMPGSIYEEIKGYGDDVDDCAREFVRVYEALRQENRQDEPLRRIRVIATLNLVDARNLFYVGDALARRFVVVRFEYPKGDEDLDVILRDPKVSKGLRDDEVGELRAFVRRLRESIRAEAERRERGMGVEGWLRYFNVSPASLRTALLLYASAERKGWDRQRFVAALRSVLGTINDEAVVLFDYVVGRMPEKVGGQ